MSASDSKFFLRKFSRQANIPAGFRFSAISSGIKKSGTLDLALIASDSPSSAAAVFTKNLVQAAPVELSRSHLKRAAARMRAIIVNSGNANCCTGAAGFAAAERSARAVARELDCEPEQILVNSTGVIGVPFPWEKIRDAAASLAGSLHQTAEAFCRVTRAIMTTDTQPKWAAARCTIGGKTVRLLGCAKGAGMIHPNMATMLAFVVTDAAIAPALLQRALRGIAGHTFNCISVDGDTSTNDTLAVLANGASGVKIKAGGSNSEVRGSSSLARFSAALESVCRSLALQIVADGEGAQRVVEIEVAGALNDADAKRIANTIATSPLVKTAFAGADPNWGRILAAAGRSGVRFEPGHASIRLAGILVFHRGRPLPFDERAASRAMSEKFVKVGVQLETEKNKQKRKTGEMNSGRARVWTCDFTGDYVKINASYRT